MSDYSNLSLKPQLSSTICRFDLRNAQKVDASLNRDKIIPQSKSLDLNLIVHDVAHSMSSFTNEASNNIHCLAMDTSVDDIGDREVQLERVVSHILTQIEDGVVEEVEKDIEQHRYPKQLDIAGNVEVGEHLHEDDYVEVCTLTKMVTKSTPVLTYSAKELDALLTHEK